MVEATVQLGAISPGKAEMQIEYAERGLRGAKGNVCEENIISAVIHVDETTPHLHCDFAVDCWGIYRRKTYRRQRKCAGLKRNSPANARKWVPRAKFVRLEPRKHNFNGLDQKFYEKMTASIMNEDKVM